MGRRKCTSRTCCNDVCDCGCGTGNGSWLIILIIIIIAIGANGRRGFFC